MINSDGYQTIVSIGKILRICQVGEELVGADEVKLKDRLKEAIRQNAAAWVTVIRMLRVECYGIGPMGNVRSNWGLYMVIIPICMYNIV